MGEEVRETKIKTSKIRCAEIENNQFSETMSTMSRNALDTERTEAIPFPFLSRWLGTHRRLTSIFITRIPCRSANNNKFRCIKNYTRNAFRPVSRETRRESESTLCHHFMHFTINFYLCIKSLRLSVSTSRHSQLHITFLSFFFIFFFFFLKLRTTTSKKRWKFIHKFINKIFFWMAKHSSCPGPFDCIKHIMTAAPAIIFRLEVRSNNRSVFHSVIRCGAADV